MRKMIIPMAAGIAAAMLLLAGMWIYYNKIAETIEQQGGNAAVYDKHYIMISEDDSEMWQSVYESAKEAAARENVYLEWVGANSISDYTVVDCMNIGIASKVDGIILYPGGSDSVTEQIDEAMAQGIPVVTVLNDDNKSSRISFVGINSYQMGEIYGEQILNYLQDGLNRVMILINTSAEDVSTNLMYSQINSIVEKQKTKNQKVEISTYPIDSNTNFEAEEVIRDIFVNSENLPDILICLDSVATECAYQAIVDYNEVGNVDIIGYYASDVILDAIQKGLIPATISIDTDEIGQYSINALNEYWSLGHVSDYFNVGLNIVTRNNVRQY